MLKRACSPAHTKRGAGEPVVPAGIDDTPRFEFALGDYLATKGIQVGSDEALNQFAYPREDVRGPQDGAWLASAVEHAEALLADVRLDRPD